MIILFQNDDRLLKQTDLNCPMCDEYCHSNKHVVEFTLYASAPCSLISLGYDNTHPCYEIAVLITLKVYFTLQKHSSDEA